MIQEDRERTRKAVQEARDLARDAMAVVRKAGSNPDPAVDRMAMGTLLSVLTAITVQLEEIAATLGRIESRPTGKG